MDKLKLVASWIPIVLVALPMIAGGASKLAGIPETHESFAMMGLPAWFGYFIGAAELAGGIGVLIPRLAALAAAGIIPIMIGAVYFHIAFDVPSPIPAAIIIVCCVYTIWMQHKKLFFLSKA